MNIVYILDVCITIIQETNFPTEENGEIHKIVFFNPLA